MKYCFCAVFALLTLNAGEVCKKCERIREYNKDHPGGEYEFYEDYLKATGGTKEVPPQEKN